MENLLKGNVISGGACSQIPQDGLIASYLLQGTAEDETGTYDGTETSMTYVYDDENGIVSSLNGSTSYISKTTINLSTAYTVSYWLKKDSNGNYVILSGGTAAYYLAYNDGTYFSSKTDQNTYFFCSPTHDLLWHHYVLTRDGTNVKMYIDGVEQTLTGNTITATDTGSSADIGRDTGATNYLAGDLNNIHIYNRQLTADEVSTIYNLEKYQHNNPLDEGLIAYYPFDKGNSLDNAINQYDGTDTNVTYTTDTDMGVVAEFNGANSYVTFSTKPSFTTTRTVSLWVYIDTALGANQRVYQYSSATNFINININTSLQIVPYIETTALTPYQAQAQTWYMVTIVTTPSTTYFYVNASLHSQHSITATAITNTYKSLGIDGATLTNNPFDGRIHKVREYTTRALSDKEIQWLYDYEKPNSTECLYNSTIDNPDPFEDGSGIALYKLDGNANDTTGVYDGTASGITYQSGEFGQEAVFDGSTSYIDSSAASVKTISLHNSCTNVSANRYIADARLTSGTGYVYIDTSGFIQFVGCTVKIDGVSATSGVTQPTLATRLHYEITFTTAETAITIGSLNTHTSSMLGSIDQVRFFNRILTASENTKLQNERKV